MSPIAIQTELQLQKVLENIVKSVMEDISDAILQVFLNDYVVKYAYASGTSRYTNPSGKFIEAWKWTDIKRLSDTFSMTMFNDWSTMTKGSQGGDFVHSSYLNPSKWGVDTRESLAEYLDIGIPNKMDGSRLGGYWKRFMSEMIESGEMNRVVDRFAKKYGLTTSIF